MINEYGVHCYLTMRYPPPPPLPSVPVCTYWVKITQVVFRGARLGPTRRRYEGRVGVQSVRAAFREAERFRDGGARATPRRRFDRGHQQGIQPPRRPGE